ncbi:MAG: hypothetical protein NTW84_06665, partial [Methanothrix sp.]|nr:hypothetical protein [Methanothrix sp.]
ALSRYVAEPRSRAVGGELIDRAPKIDLNVAALWCGIETMGGKIESQITGVYAGIIEGRNRGHEI